MKSLVKKLLVLVLFSSFFTLSSLSSKAQENNPDMPSKEFIKNYYTLNKQVLDTLPVLLDDKWYEFHLCSFKENPTKVIEIYPFKAIGKQIIESTKYPWAYLFDLNNDGYFDCQAAEIYFPFDGLNCNELYFDSPEKRIEYNTFNL